MDKDEIAHGTRRQAGISPRVRRLLPLALATMASQAVLVVLTPTLTTMVAAETGQAVLGDPP